MSHLDVLLELRPRAKTAMVGAARRQPGWKILNTIPFLGPVRMAFLLAIMRKPWRFRTKRNRWPDAGLAVVRQSSAHPDLRDGKLHRSKKAPMTRGLNRNHNPMLKSVFQGAANAAVSKAGPMEDTAMSPRGSLSSETSLRRKCRPRSKSAIDLLRHRLTLSPVKVEWDHEKSLANLQKHGVTFQEASELFTSGVDYLEIFDDEHSVAEDRFIAIGPIRRGLVLVIWTERDENTTRIISARWATRREQELYVDYLREQS